MENWTGERLETFVFNDATIEHLHRYALALQLAKDKIVLDIASGEGYGTNLIAQIAKKATGVDISDEIIEKARKKYTRENLNFKTGSASAIPLPDGYFDLVVSFETIEHHDEHEKMIKEIKRVLKPNGILLLSSPEKKNYSEIPNTKNIHHIKELYLQELKLLINKYFSHTYYFFQKKIKGSIIIPETNNIQKIDFYSGGYKKIEKENFDPIFNICIAGDVDFEFNGTSMFNGDAIYKSEIEQIVNAYNDIYKNSKSYRIGRFITSPFRLFKRPKYVLSRKVNGV